MDEMMLSELVFLTVKLLTTSRKTVHRNSPEPFVCHRVAIGEGVCPQMS
jgi:hypothetical protein